RGQLLSDDALAERRVVPGERLLEAAGLDMALELEPDLRVKGLGREALGDDSVDRDPVLAALSAMGAHELCANARGQALELSLEPWAVEEIVKRLGLGARGGGSCDPRASIVLQGGRGRDRARGEDCSERRRDRRDTHHPDFPLSALSARSQGNLHKQCLKPRSYTASKSIGYGACRPC